MEPNLIDCGGRIWSSMLLLITFSPEVDRGLGVRWRFLGWSPAGPLGAVWGLDTGRDRFRRQDGVRTTY